MNYRAPILLMLVAVAYVYAGAPDNRGTEFIVGYMANYVNNKPVELFITTAKTTTVYVQVSAPRYPSIGLNENFEVIAGTVKHLKFSNSIRGVGTALESKAVYVTASDEVVVYGVNMEAYSSDSFLAFPLDVIGDEYFAVSHYPSEQYCEFMVIGVYDQTTVTIRYATHSGVSVSYAGTTYGPGSTQTITVNKFDTYQAQTMGDLTGSYVTADKHFVFMSGNKLSNVNPHSSTGSGGTRDTMVDQMMPVKTWGTEFAIVPTPFRTVGDQVRFIPANDSTTVKVECSGGWTRTFTVNSGSYRQEITPSDQVCHCKSDKPLMVILIVISMLHSSEPADPALITIPPMEQYAADYTFATPRYSQYPSRNYRNYFMFIVKDAEKDQLKADGSAFPSNTVYKSVPNTKYVGGYIELSDGTHTIRHDSPISVFGGFMYGAASAESYGMPTGLRLSPINEVCQNTTTVVGDGIDNDCDGLIDEEICVGGNSTDDDGDTLIDEDCAAPTPIHGNWGVWAAWTTLCYQDTSTGGGKQPRRRQCDDPAPQYDGNQCSGSDTEYQACTLSGNSSTWPQDGGYTGWTQWTSCTITCGTGTVQRTRSCTNPTPANGGLNCSSQGLSTLTKNCFSSVTCPVIVVRDGGWAAWETWSACTKTCDTGRKARVRYCSNPTPMNGLSCAGDALELDVCNTGNCTGNSAGGSSMNGFMSTMCPSDFFPCKSGAMLCIPLEYRCDCLSDCSDASDEDMTWAQCSASGSQVCGNAANGIWASTALTSAMALVCLVTMFRTCASM